jgi:hypothetical protein
MRAALQYFWSGTERVHDQQRSQRGLIIEEHQQRAETSTDLLTPRGRSVLGCLHSDTSCAREGIIEHCEEAVLAPLEEIVERTA